MIVQSILPETKNCFGLQRRQTDERINLMFARTAAATVEQSLPVESTIEAELKSLIQEQTPKPIQVEEQIPKCIQIEEDAERSRSFVAGIGFGSIVRSMLSAAGDIDRNPPCLIALRAAAVPISAGRIRKWQSRRDWDHRRLCLGSVRAPPCPVDRLADPYFSLEEHTE